MEREAVFRDPDKSRRRQRAAGLLTFCILCRSFNFSASWALDYFVHTNIVSLDINTKVLVMDWKFIIGVFHLDGNGFSCIVAVYLWPSL